MITIERASLDTLLEVLKDEGYTLLGPTLRDNAIVCDKIDSAQDLPVGWGDEQDGGTYRLMKRDDDALFAYVVGPQSFKKSLFPPAQKLWSARRTDTGFELDQTNGEVPAYAMVGIRSCELHAIAIQDRVFLGDRYVDPAYKARRERAFTVAVNCGHAGGTCFCASMDTGPKARSGYDIALTEVLSGGRHYFVVDISSQRGKEVMAKVPGEEATKKEVSAAEKATSNAESHMKRSMDTTEMKALLCRNLEHPQWDIVARRCLTCGNCTLVCPTCFCSSVDDTTDLTGDNAERWRRWDSCFTGEFSYIHGGSVRHSSKSRYRQWMTHKLASWVDQFGTVGCVGCGRCITWCPVGIDITVELEEIRKTDGFGSKSEAAS